MLSNLPVPDPLRCDPETIVENWRTFKESWTSYEIATALENEDDNKRVAIFKSVIGRDGLMLLRQINALEEKTVKSVITLLDLEIAHKRNIIYERYLFFSCNQGDMSYSEYIRVLKEKALTCNFGTLEKEMVRDKFVVGIIDMEFKQKLLKQRNLTLEKVTDEALTREETIKQMETMCNIKEENIFDLQVEHPYHFISKYAKCLKGDETKLQKMVQMALTFVNDSLCTTLCLHWDSELISVALLYLAGKLSKFEVVDWSGRQPKHMHWWDMFLEDVTVDLLEDICHQVLDLYSQRLIPADAPDTPPLTPSRSQPLPGSSQSAA